MIDELSIVASAQRIIRDSAFAVAFAVFSARWLIFAFIPLAAKFFVSTKRDDRHAVHEAAWAAALALGAVSTIAFIVERARPFMLQEGVALLIPPPLNTSFPSGHTATSFAIASTLAFADRRMGIVAFAIATLVALGRLFVGVHYPTDLAAGALLGMSCFLVVRMLHRQLRKPEIERAKKRHTHV